MLLNLRTYPPRFGQRIAKFYDIFCNSRVAYPSECDADNRSALDILYSINWGKPHLLDEHAQLDTCFLYLRGSKGLDLGDWRPAFPTSL